MGKFFKKAGVQKEIYKLLKPEALRMHAIRTFDDIRKGMKKQKGLSGAYDRVQRTYGAPAVEKAIMRHMSTTGFAKSVISPNKVQQRAADLQLKFMLRSPDGAALLGKKVQNLTSQGLPMEKIVNTVASARKIKKDPFASARAGIVDPKDASVGLA